MAAKRPRGDKSVLSRQDIASRKRAIKDQKLQTDGTGRRALIGVAVLALSVLALLAVATFDARDRVGPGFHNAIGPVGHALAESLRGLLGLCAYVLPLAGIYAAVTLFVGSHARRRWPQLVSLALLSVAGAVLAQLMFQGDPGWAHAPGGVIGHSLANVLCGLFSVVGTVVLVSALCVAALIVGTQLAFLKLCAFGWRAAVAGTAKARVFAVAFWAGQKDAYARRREAAAKSQAEEAAFLEKLEADEAELAEAEAEANEAEAMAEEAVRLARVAEEARAERKKVKEPPKKKEKEVEADEEEEEEEAVRATFVPTAAPLNATPLPGADPAWASFLAPQPRAAPVAPAADAPKAESKKKERKVPQVVVPPPPPAAALLSGPPAPAAEPLAAPLVKAADPLGVLPGPSALALATAPAVTAAKPAPVPVTALARTPLIVEPKAPPAPTKKKAQDFEFVGGRSCFVTPPLDVLECDKKERTAIDKDAFLATAEKLRAKLADFGIVGEVVEIRPGPVVTMYEFLPGPGIKISKIASLSDDLAMAMEAMRVRIVAPIPGKGVVGIEVPNKDRETVYLKEIAEQDAFTKSASRLTMCLGKDIEGMPYVFDLAKAPHLLIAGTTGSGKSVAVNSMIMSILLKSTPEEVRFIMVDPKMLELSVYEGIPHLLLPVVTDPKKAALALRWAVEEMERRYHLLSEAGVRHISNYNKMIEAEEAEAKAKKAQKPDQKAREATVEGKVAAPAAPEKKRKMLIVDVADDESEEEALARKRNAAASTMGVAAPKDEPSEMREEVQPSPEEQVKAQEAAAEIRVEADTLSAEESAALDAASAAETAKDDEKKDRKKLPFIVVIIDELADLMMVASREVETSIARLAQMARAAGIHLMVATQRPSTDVVTGVIKANFPTRISFMLRSKPDSMTIIGTIGAEALLGMGDMLIMPPTSAHLQRVHGAFVSEVEIKRAVDHLKAQGKPVFDESILKPREEDAEAGGEEDELSDELYDQALATVSEMRTVSISMLQRKMRIGYNRAARMIERMERDGVVGSADGAKPREVLLRPLGEMPGAGASM
jgi:S-DNA-T family DNA segregation ATPase FtsK/SpoIIIE